MYLPCRTLFGSHRFGHVPCVHFQDFLDRVHFTNNGCVRCLRPQTSARNFVVLRKIPVHGRCSLTVDSFEALSWCCSGCPFLWVSGGTVQVRLSQVLKCGVLLRLPIRCVAFPDFPNYQPHVAASLCTSLWCNPKRQVAVPSGVLSCVMTFSH